jgi:hypothetical protein
LSGTSHCSSTGFFSVRERPTARGLDAVRHGRVCMSLFWVLLLVPMRIRVMTLYARGRPWACMEIASHWNGDGWMLVHYRRSQLFPKPYNPHRKPNLSRRVSARSGLTDGAAPWSRSMKNLDSAIPAGQSGVFLRPVGRDPMVPSLKPKDCRYRR